MSQSNTNNGLGFGSVLAIVFIVLKLVGVIHWSWLWVLAPLWIPLGIVLAIIIFAGILHLLFIRD